MSENAISLLEFQQRVGAVLAGCAALREVWVTAETSDVRTSGGHCYMELIDKDPDSGAIRARARATIWASIYNRINAQFAAATGSPLRSDIKVMVKLSATYHPSYGMSLSITDLDPTFTLGDLLRRRMEMVARLQREGILELNRNLRWAAAPLRVAVISAPNAAGYGDFINQLYGNTRRLRFSTKLYRAVLQGDQTAPSIISALRAIAADGDAHCVVIIRGGGATSDLAAYDNYELAAEIARFPIPVVIGIGHQRDVTLLDYVANTRVKTPTAAAEYIISLAGRALDRLQTLAQQVLDLASGQISNARTKLATIAGQLPTLAQAAVERERLRVGQPLVDTIATATANITSRQRDRLKALSELLDTLSPEATLRRGFSITRINGHAVTSTDQAAAGDVLETTLAAGTITSTVTSIQTIEK